MMKFSLKRIHAFTLLEMLITVSLMGLLLTTSLAMFDEISNSQRLNSAASQLSYSIDYAKSIAQNNGVSVDVELSANSSEYILSSSEETYMKERSYGTASGELPDGVIIKSNNCGNFGYDVSGNTYGDNVTNGCMIILGFVNSSEEKSLWLNSSTGNIEYD